jgi:mRNA-decapping enzyme subunit 2
VRFIINLPNEELESVERICFQVEEAQWFYEDFIRPLDPSLPSMPLRTFCLRIFQHCPLLSSFSEYHHATAFSEFLNYKTRVPVRGAIMLNDAMDQVVLVKGWKKGANWSFPRGKINKDEADLDCAVREVYEETGFDILGAGLVSDEKHQKHIEITLREQNMRLYVFRGVPMDTHFEPRTRKEISVGDIVRKTVLSRADVDRSENLMASTIGIAEFQEI